VSQRNRCRTCSALWRRLATAASREAEAAGERAGTTGLSVDEMHASTGRLSELSDVLRSAVARFLQQVRAA